MTRSKTRRLTSAELAAWRREVAQKHAAGWPARKLARWYGVNHNTIYTAIKKEKP